MAGVALIGVPPSGAYLAKELLLQAAAETGQWWWEVVIQAGGIFTSGYVVLVLAHALAPADEPVTLRVPVSRMSEAAALALALCSLLLGLIPWEAYLPVPAGAASSPLTLAALVTALWPILAGAVLAILLGRWSDRLARVASGSPCRDGRSGPTHGACLGQDGRADRWHAPAMAGRGPLPPDAGDPLRCGNARGPMTARYARPPLHSG